MHELSIAESLLEQVNNHTPAGVKLQRVIMEAGPLQGIDEEVMQQAWKILTAKTEIADSVLEINQLPWTLHCPQCQREWTSETYPEPCACGFEAPNPVGGNELRLDSLIVDDPEDSDPKSEG